MIGKHLPRIVDTALILLLLAACVEGAIGNPWTAFRMSVLALLMMIVVELKRKAKT